MKFHSLYLKDTCHGRLSVCGHTITLGNVIASITFNANTQLFEVLEVGGMNKNYVPVSNVRNAIAVPEIPESNENKGKGK